MNLKKPLGMFSEQYKEPLHCESCGGEFICGATIRGCWCMKVKLSDETRADIKSKFERCLCPKCLEQIAVDPR
ncbi:MAG: cysteine-rich CWC family protein [Pyrinomonadaceae bacterium]|nr:cysteine-rich CWC family protein [Pyrinomonadaceae bacterium]